jgi:hypothetical protein
MQIKSSATMKKIVTILFSSCILWAADGLYADTEAPGTGSSEMLSIVQKAPLTENADVLSMEGPTASAPIVLDHKAVEQKEWAEFHAVAGRCKMSFPTAPEHVSHKLNGPEPGYDLNYDAYISALDERTVFMLLVAQYPEFVDESYAQMSLEAFLNGILTYNPENQLIKADLLLVEGHEALDFFIRTGSVYFKGRAVMVKNSLYLMAMECDIQIYDEQNYNKFIGSFTLANTDGHHGVGSRHGSVEKK